MIILSNSTILFLNNAKFKPVLNEDRTAYRDKKIEDDKKRAEKIDARIKQ